MDKAPADISVRPDGTLGFAAVDQMDLAALVCKASGIQGLDGCYPSAPVTFVERVGSEFSDNDIGSIGSTATWTDVPLTWNTSSLVRSALCSTTAIAEEAPAQPVSVFPVPASDVITVRTGRLAPYRVAVIDGLGRTVQSSSFTGTECRVPVADLDPGHYSVRVCTQAMELAGTVPVVVVRE